MDSGTIPIIGTLVNPTVSP